MNDHQELQTIRDFLRFAVSAFQKAGLYYGHGTDNAWDEARFLIWHQLHLPYALQHEVLDARLCATEKAELLAFIERRVKERLPLAYLTHEAWFAGLAFYVDERVLVPRSPIAELIENQFQPWLSEEPHHILDLCTGSGCIAIACAKAFPEASVDAVDLSTEALAVAKINTLRHDVDTQVQLYPGNLFDPLAEKQYDLIVSNPPYVGHPEMQTLPAEYQHEPALGLVSGPLGLDCTQRILEQAAKHLKPKGLLIVEVGNSEDALIEAYPDVPFTWLEFERGGGGVFLLTTEQVRKYFSTKTRA